jgi:hypothetical protein
MQIVGAIARYIAPSNRFGPAIGSRWLASAMALRGTSAISPLPDAGATLSLSDWRSFSLPEEYAYYRVYGPEATSLPELIAVAGQRWQIEHSLRAIVQRA